MGHRKDRGHSSSSSKRHKHSSKTQKRGDPDPSDAARILKYASLGKARKLRKLADRHDTVSLDTITDSQGATALHHAARHGHLEVVQLLLRRAADPSVRDAAGNTPGHLAAMHGHLLVLTELVKGAGINLDQPNAAGFTVRKIVQQQRQQAGTNTDPSAGPSQSGGSSPSSSLDARDAPAAAAAAAGAHSARSAAAAAAGMGRADEDDWMDKLAYEMSYDDGGGWHGAWGGAMAAAAAAGEAGWDGHAGSPAHHSSRHTSRLRSTSAAAASAFAADGEDDPDDAWADRLWQDMQDHKRQAAAAAKAAAYSSRSGNSRGVFGAGPSRDEAAQERERRATAAAAESARILQEEQAKDADWRAAMKRQIGEAALPLRRSTYEERWQQLESWPASKPITYQDVPWPCPVPGSQAAARKQQQQQALVLDPKQLQTLVLAGAKSAADIKLALRRELMRWHPDKFTARFGPRLAAADKEAIDAGVHAVAQQLTALKQQ